MWVVAGEEKINYDDFIGGCKGLLDIIYKIHRKTDDQEMAEFLSFLIRELKKMEIELLDDTRKLYEFFEKINDEEEKDKFNKILTNLMCLQ